MDTFISKWEKAEVRGSYINYKAQKELLALKGHISKGCLSNILVQAGTNRNENLHRFINPYFRRCRMGIPLALALLTILFHHHNKKYTNMQYILSAKANYVTKDTATDQDVYFGIIEKTDLPSLDNWIFAKRSDLTTMVRERQLANVTIDIDVEDIRVQDLVETLQSALHIYQLSISLRRLSNNSPLLNQRMLPFMCAVSCLFLPANGEKSEQEEHQQRLHQIVKSWGFEMFSTEGDGNCCFSAVAFSLTTQKQQINLLPNLFTNAGIDIEANISDISYQLCILAIAEWRKHSEDYQGFLDEHQTVSGEAENFLQQGYFHGPLGNTMVLALSNALGLPIVIFSSALHYPIIHVSPRVCRAAIPLYVAFNQSGAGHYNAVLFKGSLNVITSKSDPDTKCTCGKGGKGNSIQHCTVIKHKYTTSLRCPCHRAGHGCTPLPVHQLRQSSWG